MIERAVINANAHGINVHVGVRNLGNGNCAFESMIDSLNTRDCFKDVYEGTPDYWRKIWCSMIENIAFKEWNCGLSQKEWAEGWALMKQPHIYEHQLGDLVLPGIAHCTRKDILIFNTSLNSHTPVYLVEARKLCNQIPDTDIPVCLAYNGVHYEGLVPDTDDDIARTIDLKQDILEGRNQNSMENIKKLFEDMEDKDNENKSMYMTKEEESTNRLIVSKETVGKGRAKEEGKEYRGLLGQMQRNKEKDVKKVDESTNKFGVLDCREDAEKGDEECFLTLDELKLIKCKDRTVEQKKRYRHLIYKQKLSEETSPERLARREKERLDKGNKRKKETNAERSERNEKKRVSESIKRMKETQSERSKRNEKKRVVTGNKRMKETPSERYDRVEKIRVATSNKRMNETSSERCERYEKKRVASARKRESPPSLNEARNAQNVLYGHQIVHELKNTADSIGSMEVRCQNCSALKWKGETSSTCCNGGKVILESFPDPPEYLQKLWKDKTTEAKLFRENARSFNNGLALSSVVVS